MAAIVSSGVTTGDRQIDGRVWVTETHTCDNGSIQVFQYLADPGLDFAQVAADRASALNAGQG